MDMEHGDMSDEKKGWKMRCGQMAAIRALTAVIVIVFVFWCGFEFGEIRASAGGEHSFGYRMMQSFPNQGWNGPIQYGTTGVMRAVPAAGAGSVQIQTGAGASGK